MRTLRELFGWALWPLVPLVLLVGLAVSAAAEDGRPALLALAFALAWPGIARLSRRLRDPEPEEIAEADGRRPVALLHGFTRSRVPLLRRLFVVQPGFWRDRADDRLERALGKSLGAAGPVVPLARPGLARSGPVAMLDDSAWRADLERRIKHARMVAVVLDESPECLHEVERAAAVVGLRKLVLLPPTRRTHAFHERFAELRGQLPQLPALASDTLAIRFGNEGQPLVMSAAAMSRPLSLLAAPQMMLFDGEAKPAPEPPAASWFLTLVALGSGVVAAIAGPVMLSVAGQHEPGDHAVSRGLIMLVLGGVMAVLSRRAVRLVPSNELPMVLVAASPWLLCELVGLFVSEDSDHRLLVSMIGAAYSWALLLGAGFALAGGALIRRAPGRRIAFGFFGLTAVVPIATLWYALAGGHLGDEIGMALLPAAGILALAVVAASGDGARAHAPLPLGAAAAATLAVAAAMTMTSARAWQRTLDVEGMSRVAEAVPQVTAAFDIDRALPWFLAALPALVALMAALHRGRVSRVSVGNVLALAPLAVVVPMVCATHAAARSEFSARYRASGVAAVSGMQLPDDAVYPLRITSGARPSGPITGVLTSSALVLRGSRPRPLGSLDSNTQAAQRALARARVSGRPRLLLDSSSNTAGLMDTLLLLRATGAPGVELIGEDDGLRALYLPFDSASRQPAWDEIVVYVQMFSNRTMIVATDGTSIEIPTNGYAPDLETIRERLRERLEQEPNRRRVAVFFERHADLDGLLATLRVVSEHFPDTRLHLDALAW